MSRASRPIKGARSLRRLPPLLAFRDLSDERMLSLCLVCAIAAVLAPIMVLAGLKFGFIEILRTRLIQDPSFRRIGPVEAQTRPESFFKQLATHRDIAFVQPNISFAGTSARLEAGPTDKPRAETFDVLPTGAGDPLLLEQGAHVPKEGEVVLTTPGAEALGVTKGDRVRLVVTLTIGGRREAQTLELEVVARLSTAADPERRAYVPLGLVQDIERYRSGIPVAVRRWQGVASPPLQSFAAVYLLLGEALDDGQLLELQLANGFAVNQIVTPDAFKAESGLDAPNEVAQIVRLANAGKPVRGQQIAALKAGIGERRHWMLPLALGLKVTIAAVAAPLDVTGYHADGFSLRGIETGDDRWRPWRVATTLAQVDRVLIPAGIAERHGIAEGTRLQLTVQPRTPEDASKDLALPVVVAGVTEGAALVMHTALAGMLLESRNVRVRFDEGSGSLVADDPGFRDFRAYGRTIDVIPGLVREFRAQGIEVRAKVDAIEQLQRLDAALTWITLIVSAVALLGGICVLTASFYASVERKQGALSLLRLLGVSRAGIFSLPILQSMMLASAGSLCAVGLFLGFARLINTHLATDLTVQGEICRLEAWHLGVFSGATLLVAVLASMLAARRTLAIDPAEALRQE